MFALSPSKKLTPRSRIIAITPANTEDPPTGTVHIPVIFHNLSGYDTHLFIRELGKETNKIGVIAENKEKYISFTTDVMVDEYQDEGKVKEKKNVKLSMKRS